MTASNDYVKVVQPGRLIDGLGGPPLNNMAVILRGSRILWVGTRDQVYGPGGPLAGSTPGSHGQVLDFPEGTLLPGLIDCHTHTNMPGDGRRGEEVNLDTDAVRLLRSARNVGRALESGVTTVCDCGSWNQTAFSLKEGLALGLVEGSRLLASGALPSPPPGATCGSWAGRPTGWTGCAAEYGSFLKKEQISSRLSPPVAAPPPATPTVLL